MLALALVGAAHAAPVGSAAPPSGQVSMMDLGDDAELSDGLSDSALFNANDPGLVDAGWVGTAVETGEESLF